MCLEIVFMKEIVVPSRLRWACRRGMLELDVLLGNFLEEVYTSLEEEDQSRFVQLLSENDQDLFLWLTGKEIPSQSGFVIMVEKIRNHAKHRHSA
jgi:antitoxin CptB